MTAHLSYGPEYDAYLEEFYAERSVRWADFLRLVNEDKVDMCSFAEFVADDEQPLDPVDFYNRQYPESYPGRVPWT